MKTTVIYLLLGKKKRILAAMRENKNNVRVFLCSYDWKHTNY
jgi:hypothetical protein